MECIMNSNQYLDGKLSTVMLYLTTNHANFKSQIRWSMGPAMKLL